MTAQMKANYAGPILVFQDRDVLPPISDMHRLRACVLVWRLHMPLLCQQRQISLCI
jgi:hypothetical protein